MYNYERNQVWECYTFARRMIGNHNPDMIMPRTDAEIFRDDFRGKLGEVAVRNYVRNIMPEASIDGEIDFETMPRGEWDRTDIVINDKHVSVKSIKGNSRFLLIEAGRYNEDGSASYRNHDGSEIRTDLYALVKVDITPEITEEAMGFQNVREFWEAGYTVRYEVLGGITHDDFWEHKHFAPAGIRCSVANLEAVCLGEEVEPGDGERLNETLQVDNYVIDSQRELVPLNELL